jgi:hypothetical protein
MKKVVAIVENFGNVVINNTTNVEIADNEFKVFCEKSLRKTVKEIRDVTNVDDIASLNLVGRLYPVNVDTHKKALLVKQRADL